MTLKEQIDKGLELLNSIVCCEDCKYCDKPDEWTYWCLGHGNPARLTSPTDFCSRGRRKNDQQRND